MHAAEPLVQVDGLRVVRVLNPEEVLLSTMLHPQSFYTIFMWLVMTIRQPVWLVSSWEGGQFIIVEYACAPSAFPKKGCRVAGKLQGVVWTNSAAIELIDLQCMAQA